ncbi:hypothetical protein C8R43DRAFT_595123 [Mycena crocata]|nr:hypothetical protein C8R43DRAFT_595123 [Mycena crocata]
MFYNRNSSSPPTDPYTPFPKTPRGQSTSAARLRSASVSVPPGDPVHAHETSKRHSYHALQSMPAGSSAWNRDRVMSLPSAHGAQTRGHFPTNASQKRPPFPSSPVGGDERTPGHPRRLQNSDPRTLLRTLNTLLDPESQRIPDFLDFDHLMALHERDVMEREQRDAIKTTARMDRSQGSGVCSGLTVFGSSLREATMYASNGTLIGGYEHDLPIVVFRCVQELCRHGFHIPTTQRQAKPDRDRLLALISAFDSDPHFGSTMLLDCPNELLEIYALLTTYLFALPEPILSTDMFEAIWAWCILPSLRSTEFLEDDNRSRCHVPIDAGIQIAQLLLRLLPLPNFSLIVYMMAFFQQLPHMIAEDIGRAVFAGRCAKLSNVADGRAERAETMLRWLLDRWDRIFKELFPPLQLHQRETIAATSDETWPFCESPAIGSSSVPEIPGDADVTPRIGQDAGGIRQPLMRLPSDSLFERAISVESDASSICSSSALGERLLDVTLELAEDGQLDKKRWNRRAVCHGLSDGTNVSDDSGYQSPEDDPDDGPPSPHPPEERELSYLQAIRRISVLERELERSDVAVADAISETFRAREQVKELEAKLRTHEKKNIGKHPPPLLELKLDSRAADDWHAILQSDTEALKIQLAEARRERDAALQVVEEIKRLMKASGCSS